MYIRKAPSQKGVLQFDGGGVNSAKSNNKFTSVTSLPELMACFTLCRQQQKFTWRAQ